MLDVAPTASAAAIKKQFWRVSLLVHPDKCAHARAGDAFNAVKKAAQVLQDVQARSEIDASAAAAEDEALSRQVMEELEQERKWRVLQGRATAQDLECALRWHRSAVGRAVCSVQSRRDALFSRRLSAVSWSCTLICH